MSKYFFWSESVIVCRILEKASTRPVIYRGCCHVQVMTQCSIIAILNFRYWEKCKRKRYLLDLDWSSLVIYKPAGWLMPKMSTQVIYAQGIMNFFSKYWCFDFQQRRNWSLLIWLFSASSWSCFRTIKVFSFFFCFWLVLLFFICLLMIKSVLILEAWSWCRDWPIPDRFSSCPITAGCFCFVFWRYLELCNVCIK